MSLFQRLTQQVQKSAFHFQVQFHEVTDLWEDPSVPHGEQRYYASCERNSKRYRTTLVASEPRKLIGVPTTNGAASAGMGVGHPRSQSVVEMHAGAAAAAATAAEAASSSSSAAAASARHSSLTFSPGSSSHASALMMAAAASSASATAHAASSSSSRTSGCCDIPFDQTLSFGCSLYRAAGGGSSGDARGQFAKKVFRFRLKSVPHTAANGSKSSSSGSSGTKVSLSADVNLAAFASRAVRHATLVFPLLGRPDPPPGRQPPQLRVTVICAWMNDAGSNSRDKDGYSSCSTSRSTKAGAGGGGSRGHMSRNGPSSYGGEVSHVHSVYHPRTSVDSRIAEDGRTGGGGGVMPSRETSRVGVAFYGQDGENVWGDNQPGTAPIFDGYPTDADEGHLQQQHTHQQQQQHGISPHSAPAVSSAAAALPLHRPSGAPGHSRTTSRVPSRNSHGNGGGGGFGQHHSDGMSEVEVRERRRDNEERARAEAKEAERNAAASSAGAPSSASTAVVLQPLRRMGSARRDDEKHSPSHALHSLSEHTLHGAPSAAGGGYRPHAHSSPGLPHARLTHAASFPAHGGGTPTSAGGVRVLHDADDLYAELSSVDVLGGLQARDDAQQADAAAAAAAHASILSTFRHPPQLQPFSIPSASPQAVQQPPRRPSIIQEEPQIHPFPLSPSGGVSMPAGASGSSSSSKMQAIEDSRARSRARQQQQQQQGATALQMGAFLPLASLPLSSASPVSSGGGAGRLSPGSLTLSPSSGGIKTLSGRSSPATPSSSSSVKAAPHDEQWMASIRAQLQPAAAFTGVQHQQQNHSRSNSGSNQLQMHHSPSHSATAAAKSKALFPPAAFAPPLTPMPLPTLQRNSSTPLAQHRPPQPLQHQSHQHLSSTLSLSQLRLGGGVDGAGGIVWAHHSSPSPNLSATFPSSSSGAVEASPLNSAAQHGPTPQQQHHQQPSVQQITSIHAHAFSNLSRFHAGHFGVIWRARMPAHLLPASTPLYSMTAGGSSSSSSRARSASAGQTAPRMNGAAAAAFLDVVVKVPRSRAGPAEIAELFSFLNLPPHPNVLPLLGLCTDWKTPVGEEAMAVGGGGSTEGPGRARAVSSSERTLCLVMELQQCNLRELALQLPPWRAVAAPIAASTAVCAAGASSSCLPRSAPDPLLLLQLLLGMARGLSHFHANGHIHRDLSLRNFMLSQRNTVLLCDFGLCRILEPTPSSAGAGGLSAGGATEPASASSAVSSSGSSAVVSDDSSHSLPLRWLAPESLLSHRFTPASDVWQWGISAWELVRQKYALPHPYASVGSMREVVSLVCTGEMQLSFCDPPDDGGEAEESSAASSDPVALSARGSGCAASPRLGALLSRCLSVTPSKRPTAAGIVREIEGLIAEWYGARASEEHEQKQQKQEELQDGWTDAGLAPAPAQTQTQSLQAAALPVAPLAVAAIVPPHAASAPPPSFPAAAAGNRSLALDDDEDEAGAEPRFHDM